MDKEFFSKTEEQEWVQRRLKEVSKYYSAYHALTESGVDLPDENTSYQILCPFHEDKHNPSGRYYVSSGRDGSHFYCFKCKLRLDGVGLYSRLKGKNFYDALSDLERRFGVKVPKRPESSGINPSDRDSNFKSAAWSDVDRRLDILEKKLLRNRPKSSLPEYVKMCRHLDLARYLYKLSGEVTPDILDHLNHADLVMESLIDIDI